MQSCSPMKKIAITGFMGAGKTTIAEALARRLGCRTVDLDSFIAAREGLTPAQIIAQDGEAAFREIEADALRDLLLQTDAVVIALGGGTWTIAANRDLLTQHGCQTVWLAASFDLCWNRITAGGNTVRPLAPDREAARKLFERRRASYELAALKVEIDGHRDIAEVAAQIESELESP